MQVDYLHQLVRSVLFPCAPNNLLFPVPYYQFTHHKIELSYKDEPQIFDAWSRPLWDWILDHLVDPDVVRHVEWDAQRVLRHTEDGFLRTYTEPWTGNRFWDIQVRPIKLMQVYQTYHIKVVVTGGRKDVVP